MYGAVPPVAVRLIEPVLFPKHNTFTWVLLNVNPACGWVIVTVVWAIQPFASVTVTVYVPAAKFVGSSCVVLLLQAYVYGAVPPVTVRLIEPVLFPKHNTFTCVVERASGA